MPSAARVESMRNMVTSARASTQDVIGEPEDSFLQQAYTPYIIGFACAIFAIASAILIYCLCKSWRAKHPKDEEQRICMPQIKPHTHSGAPVQPPQQPYSYDAVSKRSDPIRIRNIQERRRSDTSSTTSLTIDVVVPSGTRTFTVSPPRESAGAEYLQSAGNRMNRKQLRQSLKNIRALHEEFWNIPMNHPESIEVPGSAAKNRYRTILPNPETMVSLPPIPGDPLSDYINANFVRGYEGEDNAFIATQGAMTHTIDDFWRLVWHTTAPTVVMVTKVKERERSKCERYWPQKRGVYEGIEVTVQDTIRKDDYILIIFHLKYMNEVRTLMHYRYTSWPDNKAPDNPITLLKMIREVEMSRNDPSLPKGPVIVHCSAGLGRTGCYIAISIGMKQLQEEQMVDVLGIVCQMRQDRGGMIQTNEQYEFVHQALCLYEKSLPALPE
ncbi:tyrosine-protein phosphatase non-receptor type 5-like [Anneissia japonica]|uniref:tyrosine-protein phosphatase non-receptor type 5-like n=1 Tax=Anneissia japonica TaxID=1529436 RepID=UPI001425B75C|nr:tyrosine-protein phosphatase non-receptor type 5-like [Anneissia japonica]XP_033118396.1 tyrosine-protein phosphatase non-receptor type 5-like [Anneissia japonica]